MGLLVSETSAWNSSLSLCLQLLNNGHKFALLQHEEFIIGRACGENIPHGFSIVCTRNIGDPDQLITSL